MRALSFTALLLALLFSSYLAGAQQLSTNYTVAYANRTVNDAAAYVNMINQSGYLIFYPNLTQAYGYLSKAESVYNTTPAVAVFYANQAVASAGAQYVDIGRYRLVSLAAMSVLTIAAAFALAMSLMKARQRTAKRR